VAVGDISLCVPSRVPTGSLPTPGWCLPPMTPASGSVKQQKDARRKQGPQTGFLPVGVCQPTQRSRESRAFYDRKRREGKRHTQALIALARRRVDVEWAMLRDGTTFESRSAA
jgi:hypothetical protein